MLKSLVLASTLLAGCTATWGSEHHTTIRTVNTVTASIAAAGMALDWCGTRHASETRTDEWEMGMPTTHIIGTSPSAHAVDAYFAIGTAVIAGVAQLVPERYRWLAYGAVASIEVIAVKNNLSTTRCGPLGTN